MKSRKIMKIVENRTEACLSEGHVAQPFHKHQRLGNQSGPVYSKNYEPTSCASAAIRPSREPLTESRHI